MSEVIWITMKFSILLVSLLSAGSLNATISQNSTSNFLTPIINSVLSSLFFPGFTSNRSVAINHDFENIFRSVNASVHSIRQAPDDVAMDAHKESAIRSADDAEPRRRTTNQKLKRKIKKILRKPFGLIGLSVREGAFHPGIRQSNASLTEIMTNQIQQYLTTFRDSIESILRKSNSTHSNGTHFRSNEMQVESVALDILERTFRRPEELASSLTRWIIQAALTGREAPSNEFVSGPSAQSRQFFTNSHDEFESHYDKMTIRRAGNNFVNSFLEMIGLGNLASVRRVRHISEADAEGINNSEQVRVEKNLSDQDQNEKVFNENQDAGLSSKV